MAGFNPYILILGIIIGIIFFVFDYFTESDRLNIRELKHKDIYTSLIAGIAIAFVFLQVIPWIIVDFSYLPIDNVLFFFILAGFVFIHLIEKYILQRVEYDSHQKVQEIESVIEVLEKEEDQIEDFMDEKIKEGSLSDENLKQLIISVIKVHKKETELELEEKELKQKIINEVYKNMGKFNSIIDYITNFMVGMIIFNQLSVNIFNASLFIVFALLKTFISNPLNRHVMLDIGKEDYEIHIKHTDNKFIHVFFTTAVLFGILVSFFLGLFINIHSIIYNAMFAFIAGVFLYICIREVIPENEKGRPIFFLIGVLAFSVIIILLSYIELILL